MLEYYACFYNDCFNKEIKKEKNFQIILTLINVC
jgi:hypothetical protein